MNNFSFILKILIPLLIVALIGALWWFFFLRGTSSGSPASFPTTSGVEPIASFGGAAGNTYENSVSGIPSTPSTATQSETSAGGGPLPRLWHVTVAPVAGAGFTVSSSTKLRFVERANGYVLEADVTTGELMRITNTLIPHVYEATIVGTSTVVMQNIDDNGITTTFSNAVTRATSSGPSMLLERRLPNNIRSVAVSPNGKEIFYVIPSASGAAMFRAQIDGSKPTQVFSSAILGWQAKWLSDGRITLVQNAASGVSGSAYELKNGSLAPLIGNIPGLTLSAHSDSGALLYSQAAGSLSLFGRTAATTTIPLPIRTVADKCVWSPSRPQAKPTGKQPATPPSLIAYCAVPQNALPAQFLDLWYRGAMHTADAWWKIDLRGGTVEPLYAPEEGFTFDAENPVIDASGNYIAFRNAADKSLWLLRITQ